MNKSCIFLQGVLNFIAGYISALYLGISYLMMTNSGKIGNQEGEGFLQVIGFFLLVVWMIPIMLANNLYNKKVLNIQKKLMLVINLFVVGVGVAIRIMMQ